MTTHMKPQIGGRGAAPVASDVPREIAQALLIRRTEERLLQLFQELVSFASLFVDSS